MENENLQLIKFIFRIKAERHYTAAIRIPSTFGRRRVPVSDINMIAREGHDRQSFILTVMETKENAAKITKRLEKEIDILAVDLFEQSN